MTDDNKNNSGWHGRVPTKIALNDLTEREQELLIHDDHFCMLPWIHIHGYPDGTAWPCCDSRNSVGNLNTHSIEEVWNDEPMKQIRRNMLNKTDSPACTRCYEKEKHDIYTMRNSANKHSGHYIKEVLAGTHEDGTADVFKLRYYDIRFSNLCNMKCRSCGDTFSSLWADENRKRFKWDIEANPVLKKKVTYCGRHETDIMDQLVEHIPYVEQIYFAGGEPLLMPEHYKLIRTLIEKERFDVQLTYNTNFMKVEYGKGNNILEDWKLFDSVSVGASLDSEGARGEYMRKGTKWDTIVRNRERMLEICPEVDFYLSPTVGLFNVLTVCDFHKSWVDKGFIKPADFHINMLYSPEDRRADVLPPELKVEAREKIIEHLQWIRTKGSNAIGRCVPEFEGLLTMMEAEDRTDLIPEFYRINDPLDEWRNEKFDDIFPELNDMRKYQ